MESCFGCRVWSLAVRTEGSEETSCHILICTNSQSVIRDVVQWNRRGIKTLPNNEHPLNKGRFNFLGPKIVPTLIILLPYVLHTFIGTNYRPSTLKSDNIEPFLLAFNSQLSTPGTISGATTSPMFYRELKVKIAHRNMTLYYLLVIPPAVQIWVAVAAMVVGR